MNSFRLTAVGNLARDPELAAHTDKSYARFCLVGSDYAGKDEEGSAREVVTRCVDHDVPVGTAYSAADIFEDPHMAARGDLVPVEDPVIGPVRQQAPFPRYVGRPVEAPSGAPVLGQHNHEVWCGLLG